MKKTLKITISPTKLKAIAYKLKQKKIPTHLLHVGRKVGQAEV
jgi:hypothetical protein